MSNANIYSDAFYKAREIAVRQQIGKQLDDMKKDLSQLHSPCLVRQKALLTLHRQWLTASSTSGQGVNSATP